MSLRIQVKEYLKKEAPPLFLFIQKLNNFKRGIKKLINYNLPIKINFFLTILGDKPYFGINYSANQVWPERKPIMERLVDKEIKSSDDTTFRILEIGTWAGASAVIWAQACKNNNRGMVFCIDTWKGTKNTLEGDDYEIKRGVKKNRILKLFLHNIRTCGLENYIIPIRASSDQAADIIKQNTFNLIYLDGDHAYSQVLNDLKNYSKLLKPGGIICGDDYELYFSQIDLTNAKKYSEMDFVKDPKTGEYFHPGVTLAINEVFKEVSMKSGFWAIRKSENGWDLIDF